eukprot:g634.t1
MECVSVDADWIFEVFTRGSRETAVFILDVRPYKFFKRKHIIHAYCIRVTADKTALADYSKGLYDIKWGQSVWWGKDVLVYSDSSLRKTHPVLEFLSRERKARSIQYYKDGFDAFQEKYEFLCTVSVREGSWKSYPSVLIPQVLYLGSWDDALNLERLKEIKIRSVVTIHNNPEELKLPSRFDHLRIELPDIPTADISVHFNSVYEHIEAARDSGHAVLVHCGAGVSRSATLCVAYLMRRFSWGAVKARNHVLEKRRKISINEGFWVILCKLQKALGIQEPLDLEPEVDEEVQIDEEATGIPVPVVFESPSSSGKRSGDKDELVKESKRQKTGVLRTLEIEVWKEDKQIGDLQIGPFGRHQRCVFGRAPGVDVLLEHASISRQHAKLEVDSSGSINLTDLGSGMNPVVACR